MWLDVLEPPPPALVQGTLDDISNLTKTQTQLKKWQLHNKLGVTCESQSNPGMEMWLDVLKPPPPPPFVQGTLVDIPNLTLSYPNLTKLTKQLDSGPTRPM